MAGITPIEKKPNSRADDSEKPVPESKTHSGVPMHSRDLYASTLGALGVVYGDIGTSPLYALRESFQRSHGIPLTSAGRGHRRK
jgi:hypothetical protein